MPLMPTRFDEGLVRGGRMMDASNWDARREQTRALALCMAAKRGNLARACTDTKALQGKDTTSRMAAGAAGETCPKNAIHLRLPRMGLPYQFK